MSESEPRPLRDRVSALPVLELPTGPRDYCWRGLTSGDAPLLAALAERSSARDHPTWSESQEEIQEELDRSWINPETDGVLCLSEDGEPVAAGLVILPPDPVSLVRVILTGGVDPAHRGLGAGRRLLEWQLARARQLLADSDTTLPAWVMSYAADLAPEHGALLRRQGFEAARYFTTLECAIAETAPARPYPSGVHVEVFHAEHSEQVRQAKNAAFADHWGSQPTGAEQWESMVSLSSFRPDLSRVAFEREQVVGFVTTEINEEDWGRQGYSSGYIGLVGTVRSWRRRGLATALLSDVLAAYRDAGLERAVLDVDTESPTGALGLYRALGFTSTARDVAYRIAY